MRKWAFYEYREKAGIGSEKIFETKDEAVAYASAEWHHLCEHDKKSYVNDVCGEFLVGLYDILYDEVDEEEYTDQGNGYYELAFDGIKEWKKEQNKGRHTMNKVIKGKRYDTETAKQVGEYEYLNYGDFRWFCDTLYQKRTGEFFLYGEGGPASKYREQIEQNTWSGGEKIIPMTEQEAKEWCEEHLDAYEYEEVFGKVEEGKTAVCISISKEAAANLKRMAVAAGISVSEYIEQSIAATPTATPTSEKPIK